jgi:hypothetical protein
VIRSWIIFFSAAALLAQGPGSQGPGGPVRISSLERHDGYLSFYWDAGRGRLLFEIPKLNQDLLYFVGAGKGIGSVTLGVDRGASYASTGPGAKFVSGLCAFEFLEISDQAASTAFHRSGIVAERPLNLPVLN